MSANADAAMATSISNDPVAYHTFKMKLIILALVLVVALVVSVALITHKKESALVRFNVEDFPEHGISLIAPSDPPFANSYSVLLKNTGSRAVVGYRIKWECVDSRGDISTRASSNIVSWIFLHGEESDRRTALNSSQEIINPDSIWLIPFGSPAQPFARNGAGAVSSTTVLDGSSEPEPLEGCASVTVIADGIFFDDGTFIGPDTTLFTEVKSQMEARYEILQGVQNDLRAGKSADEIFRGLERIRDQESVELGENPTSDEFRTYFRNLFAQDLLGKKELWGADRALEEVLLLLSRPWVSLRKL